MSAELTNKAIRELPLLISIERVGEELGVGRSTLYELFQAGKLSSVKVGRRRLVRRDDLLRFVCELPTQGFPQ
jgi:excisionase family DNA binding protein